MNRIVRTIESALGDRRMYVGILAEATFVLVLLAAGLAISFVLGSA